ncbi:MAG: flavodoxin family protein [Ignisphaera sp.]|uniref:Flavodoxin family protein n=1 Tax=Ignisphaera aggregans TaxID=334771 RepID=A0A7J3MX01_9CREN
MDNDINILLVSASPRRYGAVGFVEKFIIELGKEVEKININAINVYEYNIQPCLGCVSDDIKFCVLPCIIDDDMRNLYNIVLKSDGFIFVTPIYWYNVPGPLKNFIDRLTVLENAIFIEGRSKVEGKVAGFIAVGNDTGALAVIQNLMAIMNSFGITIPPWALAYHESEEDPVYNEKFVLDIANVLRCVVLMVKLLKGKIYHVEYWYRADTDYISTTMKIARRVYDMLLDEIN